MTSQRRLRTAATLAGVTLAVLASSWAESSAKSKKPKPPPEPPPAPAAMVALPASVMQDAATYSAYVGRTTGISPTFPDGAAIASSLSAGAAYEPSQLIRGAIAYGAVVALQDPAFRAGFRTYKSAQQRQEVAYAILRDPYYATAFPGAAGAAAAVVAAVGGQGRSIFDQGKLVKQSAYDIQKLAWSKGEVLDRAGRLQQAKTLSQSSLPADGTEIARLQRAMMSPPPAPPQMSPIPIDLATGGPAAPPPPAYTSLVVRALAVAALGALGQSSESAVDQSAGLMVDPGGTTCLKLAKLNLYQCLAVSKPHYEDVFCLGEHIMMDTGRCLMKTAGAVMPVEPRKVYLASDARPYKPAVKRTVARKKKR